MIDVTFDNFVNLFSILFVCLFFILTVLFVQSFDK